MRIGIISRRFWPYSGPLEVEAADVAQAISESGHHVEVLTIDWGKNWPRQFQFREIDVVRLSRRTGGPWGMFRYLRELNRYVKESAFDCLIIYGLGDESWAAIRNFVGTMPVGLRIDQPEWHRFSTRRLQFRQKRFLNQLTRIWVDSPETRAALLQSQVSPELVEVLLPCIQRPADFERSSTRRGILRNSLSDAHPILEIESHLPLVVCGLSQDDEGLDHLLTAWKLVLRSFPRARMWILGEGPLQQAVWQRVCDRQLSGSIVMPGEFDQPDDILVAADVYVHPLIADMSCHRFARAMVTGTCLVAVTNSFTERWIENQQTGLLAPPANAPALAEAMMQALRESELRSRLGSAAQAASHPFDVKNSIEKLLAPTFSSRGEESLPSLGLGLGRYPSEPHC